MYFQTRIIIDAFGFEAKISARLAGDCSHHTCPDETYCVIIKPGETACHTETWQMVTDTTSTTPTTTVPTTTTTSSYTFVERSVPQGDGSFVLVNELVASQTLSLAEVENLIIDHRACVATCGHIPGGTYQSCANYNVPWDSQIDWVGFILVALIRPSHTPKDLKQYRKPKKRFITSTVRERSNKSSLTIFKFSLRKRLD
ncbi:hypothetical protein LOTGIDRAFT_157322 [Lottia gigantea]|uniref:Uncharacterized protein n=1 Tax=Lottia gigantea TaxID=225164 RepID=V4CIZ9_LOTGI|nr:hypothetical protein LOTGIDRAFT_157322 [Lottia gigantea]ESP02170.1 hypothetical protein LOTGIDRAFT_157322 [Lottia gigantea]